MYDSRVVQLNLNTLIERLACVKKQDYYPLVMTNQYRTNYGAQMETLYVNLFNCRLLSF